MADPRFGVRSDRTEPSDFYPSVTPSDTPLEFGPCRAILCSEDGFLNLTDKSGEVRSDVPLQKGYNPLAAWVIDQPDTGSAPGTVIALY